MERRILSGVSLVAFLFMILFVSFGSSLAAEKYPSRPIEIVTGFSDTGDLQTVLWRIFGKYRRPLIP
jgi:hypothetical protein